MKARKHRNQFLAKHGLMLMFTVAIVMVVGILTYARYNDNQNYAKRVIRTESEEKNLFTSNYLSASGSTQVRTVTAGTTDDVVFDVSVYNYNVKKVGTAYPTTLTYKLSAYLMDSAGENELTASEVTAAIGNENIYVYGFVNGTVDTSNPIATLNSSNLNVENIARTIARSVDTGRNSDRFQVVIPIEAKDKDLSVKIVADADPSDLNDLRATFAVSTQNFERINGWRGHFTDDQGKALSLYDGFNFTLEGNGNLSGKLKWKTGLLEPNAAQLQELFGTSTTGTSGAYTTLDLNISSDSTKGRYDIQFYIVDETARGSIDSMQWSTFADSSTGSVVFVENSN